MKLRRIVTISCAAVAVLVIGYWGTARYSAEHLIDAFNRGDQAAVDAAIDWDEATSAVAKDVAASFPDPRAQALTYLLTGTYKSIVLRSFNSPQTIPLRIVSSGFTNIDEYTLAVASGNRWVLQRRGTRWLVSRSLLTLANERKLGMTAEALADPATGIVISAGDIYFGDPKYGCRLTTTADVAGIAAAPGLIAYVRAISSRHTQIWLFNFALQTSELILDGKSSDDPQKSTEHQANLAFSSDGRFLYFTADAWVTSSAIDELDVKTKTPRFLASGNSIGVIEEGKYAGDLLAVQNRHHPAPEFGLYEQAVVLDSKGNELAYVDGDYLTSDFDHEKHELPRAHQIDETRPMPELLRIAHAAE